MNFTSDTSAPAHPAIIEAISDANSGSAPSYGADPWTLRARDMLREVFETDLEMWLVGSGTAANALGLSLVCPSTDAVVCHRESHVQMDERGAVTFYGGGVQLALVDGEHGRIGVDDLRARLGENRRAFVHETPVSAVSLSNLTEAGTVYSAEMLTELAGISREGGARVHLDGARFANAIVALGATPSSLSWRAGVDVLSFGGTKNGAMGCEAVVLFGEARELEPEMRVRAKRAGLMPPKMRFLAAQLCALLEGGLWLELAGRANAAASQLAGVLQGCGGELVHPVEGNEVFVRLEPGVVEALAAGGCGFHPWPDGSFRFVCSWGTRDEELAGVARIVGGG